MIVSVARSQGVAFDACSISTVMACIAAPVVAFPGVVPYVYKIAADLECIVEIIVVKGVDSAIIRNDLSYRIIIGDGVA
jgi:hypothetical protein